MTGTYEKIPNEVRYEQVLVTPALAEYWLKLRSDKERNRKITPSTVENYALIMLEEQWSPTAGLIQFDTNGHLKNGSHRLGGVIMADINVIMTAQFGCAVDDFEKIDDGKPRNQGQFMAGSYCSERQTAARIIHMATTGKFSSKKIDMYHTGQYLQQSELRDADTYASSLAADCKKAGREVGFPASVLIAVMAQATRTTYSSLINEFLQGLITQEGLKRNDPRLALIRAGRATGQKARGGTSGEGRYGKPYRLVVKAWNAYVTNKEVHHFQTTQDIPKVVGASEH